MPKIHKPLVAGLPKYRPIISQIGSATYKIAKFLLTFVAPLTTNEHTVNDTFHFVSMLDGKNHRYFMASLDVDSLFSNIPLEETIDIVTNGVYGRKRKVKGIWKNDFKELLLLSTKGTVFYFHGSYYRQKDGVAMGSPLGPALANAFLCHHETSWLDDCPLSYAPVFYARYVDDIFVLLHSTNHASQLAVYLSSKHTNINFTYELEENDTLPFLDVKIFRDADRFTTSIPRKDTFSGVYTNYAAFIPIEYKRRLVATLLHRAYMINSSFFALHDEIIRLKDILKRNGYPGNFIEKCVFHFFNKMYQPKIAIPTVPKREVQIILPFLGASSWSMKNNLQKTFNKILPFCDLKIIFKTGTKMSSYFKFKDTLPKSLRSGVIYQFNCAKCNLSYVGSTWRFWERRLQEHLHISALTGEPLNGCQIYPPMQHTKHTCQYQINRDDFKIIGTEKNHYLIRIKESLFIYKLKPRLNNTESSTRLYLFV